MHRVLNYGSALQAFATQWVLKTLGYDSEIIDYEYKAPVEKFTFKLRVVYALVYIRDLFRGFPKKRKKSRFEKFYSEYFTLTDKRYTADSIVVSPPEFDVYMSGSDQVWNPRFAGNDVNFMLAFAPKDKLKLSFASSFATDIIDNEHRNLYAPYLSRFDAISVREQTGIAIVKDLTGKESTVCCDPTLLLSQDIISKLSSQSAITVGYKYVLVYGLYYMFNPYPYLYEIVNYVSDKLKCRVVYLEGRNADLFKRNAKVVSDAGPCEFLWLFEHAEFVVTTSFHGTAFSLLYEKPFFSVVDNSVTTDSRITSLCKLTGAERSIIDYRQIPNNSISDLRALRGNPAAMISLKEKSLDFLNTNLKCAK